MVTIENWEVRRSDGSQWIAAQVPGTVLSSYVAAGLVPDPLYDDNWNEVRKQDEFFCHDFEYRAMFELPERGFELDRVVLSFDAINWKADVYVNGRKCAGLSADAHSIEGAFIRGRFDVTDSVRFGASNVLEVLIVCNATPGEITTQGLAEGPGPNGGLLGADNPTLHASVGWDWIPTIPGRNIGIYGDVRVAVERGAVIVDPWIETRLNLTETSSAIAATNLLSGFEPWSGDRGDALVVDLGAARTVGSVTLKWGSERGGAAADIESRHPTRFKLESSVDGLAWQSFASFPGGEVELRFFGKRYAEPNDCDGLYEGHAISDSAQGGTAIVPMDLSEFGMGNVEMPVFAPNQARFLRFTVVEPREINGKSVETRVQELCVYSESPEQVEQSMEREFELDSSEAQLTFRCELHNPYSHELEVPLELVIDKANITVRRNVTLSANETLEVEETLALAQPQLWWPNTYGEQYLYTANVTTGGNAASFKFGVREFAYPVDGGLLTIYCNGTRIVCKGGNWGMDDAMKRDTAEVLDHKVHLHSHANMTMIRNWVGMTNHPAFYDACDRYGVLIWDDFWLANPVDGPNPNDNAMFLANAADKIRRYRSHAALCCYCGRNEGDPPEPLYTELPELVKSLDITRTYFQNSASAPVGSGGGYSLAQPGGNGGIKQYFNDVTSPVLRSERGIPNVPNLESIKRFLRSEHLWPINEVWALHDWTYHMNGPANSYMAAVRSYLGGEFEIPEDRVQGQKPDVSDAVFVKYKADIYHMCEEVGKLYTFEQFCKVAQLVNYDNHRGLFDALSTRRSNGLLMWMSQSSWPSFMWQTYDYYLDCNGGYYGARAGCEPVKAIFDPRTEEIVVSNATPHKLCNVEVWLDLYNLSGKLIYEKSYILPDLYPDTYGEVVCKVDFTPSDSDLCFVRARFGAFKLSMTKVNGRGRHEVGRDFDFYTTYWHNRKKYQDYRTIGALPESMLRLSTQPYLSVKNIGDTPAVCLHCQIVDDDGNDILPVYWSDNYFTLMPGEHKVTFVQFSNPSNKRLHFKVNSTSVPLFSST